ncbi:MAG: ankyrin repeat domain-containing protein (plasmid) [Candidatus Algichlamydia australiensis]|nr:ankyrin repeat domain-containing protein [Chlamydiales bacterium]
MNRQVFAAALSLGAALFGLTKTEKSEAKYEAYEHIKEFYAQVGEGSEEFLEEYLSSKAEVNKNRIFGLPFPDEMEKIEKWDYIFRLLSGEREAMITQFGSHVDSLYTTLDTSKSQEFLQEFWKKPKLSQEAFPLLVEKAIANQDIKALRIILEACKGRRLPKSRQIAYCVNAIKNCDECFTLEAIRIIADEEVLDKLADYAYRNHKLAIAEELMMLMNNGEGLYGGGSYSLGKAVRQHDLSQVRSILDSNPQASQENISALETAIKKGFLDIVKEFIEHGVDPNSVGRNHYSLIQVATKEKQEAIAEYLLSLGLDFSKRRGFGKAAIDFAAQNNMWKIVQLLQEQGCEYSDTVLIYGFIRNNQTKEIESLAASGFHIDGRTANEQTPLMYASEHGKLEAVKSLVTCGADINVNVHYNTPLSLAIGNDHIEVARFLLRSGADPRQLYGPSYRLLKDSCEKGDMETVRLLIEGGLDVNYTWNGSERFLLAAAKNNQKTVVEYLLQNGAEIPFGKKESFLEEARANSREAIVEMLKATPEQV